MKIPVPFFEVIVDMNDVEVVVGSIVISIVDENILLDDDITVDIGVQVIPIIQKYKIVFYNTVY